MPAQIMLKPAEFQYCDRRNTDHKKLIIRTLRWRLTATKNKDLAICQLFQSNQSEAKIASSLISERPVCAGIKF